MRFTRYLAAALSGYLLTFSFAHWNVGLMVWFWIFPLLIALWAGTDADPRLTTGKARAWRGFRLGLIAGMAFFIPNLFWVRHSSRVINGATDHAWMGLGVESMGIGAAIGLGGYLALYWGVWGAFAATVGRPRITESGGSRASSSLASAPATLTPAPAKRTGARPGELFSVSLESLRAAIVCALAWVGLEWLRSIVFTGFPWNGLGVAMRSNLALIQSADLVGVIGLSFLPVAVACIGFNTVLRFRQEIRTSRVRPHLDFFLAVGLLLLNFFYGVSQMARPIGETIPVKTLLIQQNTPQQIKFSGRHDYEIAERIYGRYLELTKLGATASQPDLVIWPESALPFDFYQIYNQGFLDHVLSQGSFSLLTGTDILTHDEPPYTGAALLQGGYENHQLYRKVGLVPFGEYLPFRSIGIVDRLLGGILPGDFAAGTSTEPLELAQPEGVQIIPLVCFEDTFGRLARKFVRDAPQFIVNCTNDGWFLKSEQNVQHLDNALFRSIELRRPMARACNTGITCFIDPNGRILKTDRLAPFSEGFLAKEVLIEKHPPMTIYARFGDLFSIIAGSVTALLSLLAYWRYRQSKNKPLPGTPGQGITE